MRQSVQRSIRAVLAWSAVAVALPAGAEDGAQARIEGRLKKARLGEAAAVTVQVQGDHAVLAGTVPTVHAQREAQRLALREVRTIENRLEVAAPSRPDADVVRDIQEAVATFPYYTVFDYVEFRVDGGTVTLAGSVREPWRKEEIEARVAEVPGFSALRNDIAVQPVSFFDDDIRRRLVRAIYGGPLATAASRAHPPVRILVENGRVTLAGWAATPMERTLITHAALGVSSFGVESRVQVEPRPAKDKKPKPTT